MCQSQGDRGRVGGIGRLGLLSHFKSLTARQISMPDFKPAFRRGDNEDEVTARRNVYTSQVLPSHLGYFSDDPANSCFLPLRQPRMGATSSLTFIKKK